MTFCLEAVYAFHGDALILHYGPEGGPIKRILIDGGARGTYDNYLKKRLEQIKTDEDADDGVPIEMVMVSHTDSDHIAGVLDLFEDLQNNSAPVTVKKLWHNSFDDVIGLDQDELVSALVENPAGGVDFGIDPVDARETEAVIQSVKQGRDLRNDAADMAMALNSPFRNPAGQPGLIMASNEEIPQGGGMTFRVLAPNRTRIEAYQEKWDEYLEEKGLAEVRAAGFNDPSAFNLASILILARLDGKSMLLTGDARGDHIVNALVEAGLLTDDMAYPEREPGQRKRDWLASIEAAEAMPVTQPFHVDLLKIPHHGSANNVTVGYFKRVTADHYLFSGNGNHHNPDVATLRMLAEARSDAPCQLYFTFTADQHETETNPKYAQCLSEIRDWVDNEKPANCSVMYREKDDNVYSVEVELIEDEDA